MFICDKCFDEMKIQAVKFILPRSRGNCERCGAHEVCYDIHHSRLPEPKSETSKSNKRRVTK